MFNHINFERLAILIYRTLDKSLSRKFLAWSAATVALFTGFIEGSQWEMITMLYVGLQTALDWKHPIGSKERLDAVERSPKTND